MRVRKAISGADAAVEHLGPQVACDEVVGGGVDPRRIAAGRLGSEHRERQQCRPSFGLSRQAGRRFGRQPQPELASQADGLALVDRELGGTDLEE